MVKLITTIEVEATSLIKSIRKFKERRKQQYTSDEEIDPEESAYMKKKTTNSLEKIGNLEKEIKQISNRIRTLSQPLTEDDM